jgi:hypothetical protein
LYSFSITFWQWTVHIPWCTSPLNPTCYVSEFLNIYLIDVVSGSVIFSVSHKRAREPVHMVHSENWLLYSYFSDKSRRTEIVTLELYEGKVQSNTTGKISNIIFQFAASWFIKFLVVCWTLWNEISSHFYNFNKYNVQFIAYCQIHHTFPDWYEFHRLSSNEIVCWCWR